MKVIGILSMPTIGLYSIHFEDKHSDSVTRDVAKYMAKINGLTYRSAFIGADWGFWR